MKAVTNILLFAVVSLTMSSGFAQDRSAKNGCDPLYGCPIDPMRCIRNPSSCGIHRTDQSNVKNSGSEVEDGDLHSIFLDGLEHPYAH